MVDPSKDQFYQQQLAPWSHLGQASGYPATHQGHGMYSAPRLNHSFPGLVPEAPSPAPPPPTSTASHHAAAGAATHPYYPMHLAALSAAAVAASDFSRPLPAHSPATAHSGASASAPLPAHLSRHPYQNYHHAYMPNYYGNHTPTMTQASTSRDANGYNPPPSSYNLGSNKDLNNSASVYNLSKNRDVQQQQHSSSDDRNGYKSAGHRTDTPQQSQFQPFPYPTQAAGHPSHTAYHYPFDMSKLGYQFGHQTQPPQAHPHHPPTAHPHPPPVVHPPSQQPQTQPPPSKPPPQARHSSFDVSRSSLAQPPLGPPGSTSIDKSRSNGINSSSPQASTCPQVSHHPAANLVPPKPNFPSHYLDHFANNPSIKQLLPQKPRPPAPPSTTTSLMSQERLKPEATVTSTASAVTFPGIGSQSVPTIEQQRLTNYEASKSQLQTAIETPKRKMNLNSSTSPPHSPSNEMNEKDSKRKASLSNDDLAAMEPVQKKQKLAVFNDESDPYRFDEDESKPVTNMDVGGANGSMELTRFGKPVDSPNSSSPGPNSAYSSYKFKSALLSRNSGIDLPKLSSKSVPLTFESQTNIFLEACDRFMEDLNSKPMSVSKRASIESFMAAQAAKVAKKAEKKAEKEQQKAEAAERRAEREERKEKERLGLIPPKPKKKRSTKNKKDQDEDHNQSNEFDTSGETPLQTDLNDVNNVKENEPSTGTPEENSKNPPVVNATNNNNPAVKEEKPKKGGTWALPIVPKMPQKPQGEKRKGLAPLPNIPMPTKTKKSEVRPKTTKSTTSGTHSTASGNSKNAGGGLTNVWLQAFGAKPSATKTPKQEPVDSKENLLEVKVAKKTFLDIPPEKRRRPKPNFGGLIHFSPDWERAVQKYHEKSRLPETLIDGIKVNPNILKTSTSGVNQPVPSAPPLAVESHDTKEDGNKYAALSSYLGSPTHSSDPGSPTFPPGPLHGSPPPRKELLPPSKLYPYLTAKGSSNEGKNDDGIANVVDRILDQRKILRKSLAFSRMYKVPFEKKKRPKAENVQSADPGLKLMRTPGLPDINEVVSGEALLNSYNNFRKQTLLRYLDEASPDLKAKILDWKPEVLENKTRHQTTKARETTAFKEIFGSDPPGTKKGKNKGKKKSKKAITDDPNVAKSPTKENDVVQPSTSKAVQEKSNRKTNNKKNNKKNVASDSKPAVDQEPSKIPEKETNDDEYIPTESEEKLQTELQTYALDLLENNLSWEKRKVIQNLVIWEPVTDPALLAVPYVPGTVPGIATAAVNIQSPSRKKAKKVRKRQSGLDFSRKKSSSTVTGKNSRDVSRAHSPALGDDTTEDIRDVKQVIHSLANVLTDSKHMVTDRSTGETVLHRAAKLGYPDVAAYALDMAKMSATVKDNAGVPPIHLAAFKGHADVVDYLIRYGADPNTNVKGTRPLHEALEQGHIQSVVKLLRHGSDPLLYDYSGNMPIDLAQESEDVDLLEYFRAILNDLHGKTANRWNVSHDREFMLPQSEDLDLPNQSDDDSDDEFNFEISSQPLPPQLTFSQYPEDKFVQASELKRYLNIDVNKNCKSNLVKMPRDEFVKTAFCCLLGRSVDPGKADPVVLVKIDSNLKKLMGINEPKLFNNLPSTSKKSKSS